MHSSNAPDPRLAQLANWLGSLPSHWDIDPATLAPASGDASFRRYFRVKTGALGSGTVIIMDAPPDKEDCRPFLHAAQVMSRSGLTVPQVHAQDLQQGFLALEDFGSVTYLDVLDERTHAALYSEASAALVKLQTQANPQQFPPYDAPGLHQ